jgi:hypothetical protein
VSGGLKLRDQGHVLKKHRLHRGASSRGSAVITPRTTLRTVLPPASQRVERERVFHVDLCGHTGSGVSMQGFAYNILGSHTNLAPLGCPFLAR